MLDDLLGSLLRLYFHACFARPDFEAMLRPDLENLILWNRGLAKVMLWLGALTLLPLALALLLFFGAYLGGMSALCGLNVETGLAFCLFGLFFVQIFLAVLLVILCFARVEWEPFGCVLAAADMLQLSLTTLQNLWRALVALPIVVLILLFSLS